MTASTNRIPATSPHSGALKNAEWAWEGLRGWDSLSAIMMNEC